MTIRCPSPLPVIATVTAFGLIANVIGFMIANTRNAKETVARMLSPADGQSSTD